MNAEERKYRNLITERRRWLALPTLDRYIFREFMIKLCVLMLVFAIIFVLGDVFDALDDFLDAEGLNLIDAGHFETENPVCAAVRDYLARRFPQLDPVLSTTHKSVIKYYR